MAFGDFTVTRASTKLRIGSNGLYGSVANNVPAFEFNTDGSYRGLLVEPGATNLALQSQGFNEAVWAKTNVTVTANAETAPDGTLTADLLANDGVGSFPRVSQTVLTSGVVTLSAFIKKNVGSLGVIFATGTGLGVELGLNIIYNYNLDTNVLTKNGTSGATATSTSVTALPNGWYRVSITFSSTTVTDIRFYANYNSATATSYYIWQAQLETGSVATSPIVTTAGTASRVADVVSLTGASSLIGQTEGTIFIDMTIVSPQTTPSRFLEIADGTASNRITIIAGASNSIRCIITTGGVAQTDLTSGSGNTNAKVAIAYATDDIIGYLNGSSFESDTSATIPALSTVNIGSNTLGGNPMNGWIRSVALFPTRLANATLASLTA
jgi:hypothetical protein